MTSNASYDKIMDDLALSGAPVIVAATVRKEVVALLEAAKRHPVMSDFSKFLWVAVDDWVGVSSIPAPVGTVGLSPVGLDISSSQGVAFLDLWKSLDAGEFPDADGDRSSIATYSGFVIDAVIALALAQQSVIDSNFGGIGLEFRQQTYNNLNSKIAFGGVTGPVDLDAVGNRLYGSYEVKNFNGSTWEVVGYVEYSTSSQSYVATIDNKTLVWPNGQTGSSQSASYSDQYIPTCLPGYEPIKDDNIYSCQKCGVGSYSAYSDTDSCRPCPEGGDCNDRGVSIPCVLPEYWRPEPPADQMGDFNKYKIFRCDITQRCLGGCQLNSTCDSNIDPTSPVCGVCDENYYSYGPSCVECREDRKFIGAMKLLFAIAGVVLGITFLFILYLDSVCSRCGFNREDLLRLSSYSKKSETIVDQDAQMNGNEKRSKSSVTQMLSFAFLFIQAVKQTGLVVTVKLTVSFFQVLAGTIGALDINWSSEIASLSKSVQYDPLQAVELFQNCGESDLSGSYIRMLLVLLIPGIFVGASIIVRTFIMYLVRRNPLISYSEVDAQLKLNDITLKSFVWFSLFSFPLLTRS